MSPWLTALPGIRNLDGAGVEHHAYPCTLHRSIPHVGSQRCHSVGDSKVKSSACRHSGTAGKQSPCIRCDELFVGWDVPVTVGACLADDTRLGCSQNVQVLQ